MYRMIEARSVTQAPLSATNPEILCHARHLTSERVHHVIHQVHHAVPVQHVLSNVKDEGIVFLLPIPVAEPEGLSHRTDQVQEIKGMAPPSPDTWV